MMRVKEKLTPEIIEIINDTLLINEGEIKDVFALKKGMTNKSFSFCCGEEKYIMRIPGEGTDSLINRYNEKNVYVILKGHDICDEPLYINPDNGYKITKFYKNARVCDANNIKDIKRCMECLRRFHDLELQVEHKFDVFQQVEFYESLWEGKQSSYLDYLSTKENIMSLKAYIDENICKRVLCHIDSVPDNFLFVQDSNRNEKIKLIDWEYAGMADPHIDIAMFCIYSLYNKHQVDSIIDLYFLEGCSKKIRIKIYCYIAVCGLLWSNWCEYKRILGAEFGEYAQRQYRYAKEYYLLVERELNALGVNK